jgi:hypothetical protein
MTGHTKDGETRAVRRQVEPPDKARSLGMAVGNGSQDPSPSRENLSIPIPCLRGRFFSPDPNSTGNGDPTGIPVPDITKEFPLYPIPDPNPTGNPHLIPNLNPTVAESGATRLFFFLLIGPIASPRGKMGTGDAIPYPNPMGINFFPYPSP